jgi:hypothetical protein
MIGKRPLCVCTATKYSNVVLDGNMTIFTSVRVEGYRSLKMSEAVPLGPITVLVGPNNAGKSALLGAIYLLQSMAERRDIRIGMSTIAVDLRFSGVPPLRAESGAELPSSPHGGEVRLRQYVEGGGGIIESLSVIPLVAGQLAEEGKRVRKPSSREPDNLIVPVLALRRQNPAIVQRVTSELGKTVDSGDANLVARLIRMQADPEAMSNYIRISKRMLGVGIGSILVDHGQEVGISITPDESVPLAAMGTGVSGALSLLIGMAGARGKLFLVEEPESDLHPEALKVLLDEIEGSSASNQFIVATHSATVLTRLAGVEGAVVLEVEGRYEIEDGRSLPTSTLAVVEGSERRIQVLRKLGYSPIDLGMPEAWLILEESSAESFIRWVIQLCVPRLAAVRTVAGQGVSRVRPLFSRLRETFLYVHLDPYYRSRAWVIVDGDDVGREVVENLRNTYRDWDPRHFSFWSREGIEYYYPSHFQERVRRAMCECDQDEKKKLKEVLGRDVIDWIRGNPDEARTELVSCAADVVHALQDIAVQLDALANADAAAESPAC